MLLQSPIRTPDSPWNFLFFVTETGRNNILKWDQKLSTKAKANRNIAMKYLRVQPIERWRRPQASSLGKHLYVIHFHDENRTTHRMCGFVDALHHVFVICVTMIEKDGTYNPADYEERTLHAQELVSGNFDKHTAPCTWGTV